MGWVLKYSRYKTKSPGNPPELSVDWVLPILNAYCIYL